MEIPAYLNRIRYTGDLQPTVETLRALHLAHLYAVPFENLDIHLGRPIVLEMERLFDKIVRHRRGGFCYELNGLFAALLLELGFEVVYLSASDAREDGSFSPEFDHLVLQVRLPDQPSTTWLADVGWGDTFRHPLRLQEDGEQVQHAGTYWLEPQAGYRLLWQRDSGGQVERQYRFSLRSHSFREFEPMCRYHQTSPDSLFTRKRLCTLAKPGGRITLDAARLITTVHGRREERLVQDEAEYRQILWTQFGIHLDDTERFLSPIGGG